MLQEHSQERSVDVAPLIVEEHEQAFPRRYPAPSLEEMRQRLRELGIQDTDRRLPPQYWGGEFANYT